MAGRHPEIEDRRDAFRERAREHGLADDAVAVLAVENSPATAASAVQRALAGAVPPTGLFCTTDMVARGALTAVAGAGLRVPADVSIIGFDDQEWARDWSPPLTTVRQDFDALGRTIMQKVLVALEEFDGETSDTPLPTRLLVRGSTRAALEADNATLDKEVSPR